MKKTVTLFLATIFCFLAQAKIWRVNNNTGIAADFTSVSTAVSSSSVLSGDTIHVEGSPNIYYGDLNLTKKLVIIGPGYYLTETSPAVANPKTQVNPNVAYVQGYIYFNAGSSGSVISGLTIPYGVVLGESNVTVQRCNIYGNVYLNDSYTSGTWANDTIRQNVINSFTCGYSSTAHVNNLIIYNNIIYGSNIDLSQSLNNVNGFFINNDFTYGVGALGQGPVNFVCSNFVFQNNIFGGVNFGAYQPTNVFFNNLSCNAGIPTGNSNQQNVDYSTLYKDYGTGTPSGFSSDGRYQLKSGSPAIGAGTLNSTTVDCGAFGGPAPYILSGMSSVPSIYALTVPAQIASGTTSMTISLSSAAH